jgi:nitronate monooxygenase
MPDHRLEDLLLRPVAVAPMGGGPSTPRLVSAAAEQGALAFLAAGYKSADALHDEIEAVRRETSAPFGVNVFVPGAPTAEPDALAAYLESIEPEAADLGTTLGQSEWDDDDWPAKLAVLLDGPPAVVSFTFACPDHSIVEGLRAAGAQVWLTVTQPREAELAAAVRPDALCVQGPEAGAHRGVFFDSPAVEDEGGLVDLVTDIRRLVDLPLVGAGGIMDRTGVETVLRAGAIGVQCGTAFLRCPESGAHPVYKAALADARFETTAVTRAFSGRPARGLVNRFLREHPDAPVAYPEINNATRPMRAAAAASGDADRMSLWAGAGFKAATDRPLAEILDALCGDRLPTD